MNDDKYTITSGHLEVGDGHKIYYQQWGNPKSEPIFYLHGGPGSGLKDKNKKLFDPKKHNVIFHDQRGSGLSTPFASTDNNTLQDLIEDIEKLREELNFKKIFIAGGSWGSTLGLAYAIAHSDRVKKMLLWGIFTGTKSEVNYIQQGGLKTHYPEAWKDYISLVPEDRRSDTVGYYLDKFKNGTAEEKSNFVSKWVTLEGSAVSIDNDSNDYIVPVDGTDPDMISLAILEAHYFINNCFLSENYIMNNLIELENIPAVLVQGRFDHVTPPETAYKLSEKYGEMCHLHIVPSSHRREGAMREAIKAYAWGWLN